MLIILNDDYCLVNRERINHRNMNRILSRNRNSEVDAGATCHVSKDCSKVGLVELREEKKMYQKNKHISVSPCCSN